ncbi:hypothetical protein CANARDRAFT_196014 [[Candida] arabinofermentans NRRL YB-2248]|uniref:DNA topoisomerase I n=1 Tax=[Candida] arabinofermentans NRRL YB-2248 TaxID=983967 RepID=A0A1E4T5F7_9ASCO|nr:hypothetical protein CANARDRAFT_196014 [[Candida] arabinofermentans NRRL YB-2248]
MSSSSDEDIPLSKMARKITSNKSSKLKLEDSSDSEDDRTPLQNSKPTPATSYSEDDDDNDDDDDGPLLKRKRKASSTKSDKKPKVKKVKTKSSSTTAVKKEKSKSATKVKKEEPKEEVSSQVKTEAEAEAEDEDDTYKWWEQQDLDGEIKWESLEHNGVVFPPEYEPLPSNVKLYYDGKPVTLPKEAEEVAGFFAAMLESDHAKNPVFQKNFFSDFLLVLEESGGCKDADIREFSKCDFTKMFQHFEKQREMKKLTTSADKKRLKKEKEEFEEPYKWCLLNGRKEQVGNFRIEPPGLFRGRGAHPKTGKFKRRVQPEDVTLNLSKDAKIPDPPPGHQWGEIRHDNNVAWLAMWRENIANSVKYVRFSQNSSLKGISDFKKFEKARELKKYIDPIRKDYKQKLKSDLMIDRQIATATYLIDVFALRAGGEKSEEEADTVGCCSLRFEHIFLKPPNTVIFDFLGKDSIRFYQEVEVDTQVFKNLRIFKKSPKKPGDDLFDRLDPSILNKFFQSYLTGLTAKVFRTYNASKTMQDQIDLIENEGTVNEKVVKFNAANRAVAILCNHQRTVSKSHETGVQKISDKIEEMMWQKIRFKRMILQLDSKQKKKNPEYFQECQDMSKEEEQMIIERFIANEKEKLIKRHERELEKFKIEKATIKKEDQKDTLQKLKDDHKERLAKHAEASKMYKSELRSRKYDIKPNVTVEKLQQQVEKLSTRIQNTALNLKDKEDNSSVALGTSKMNYIDPRLTVMFSKKFNVPIEKLFTKTLREKFAWAVESADENWRF